MSVRDGALLWDINGCRVKPPDSFEDVRASGSGAAQVVRMNRTRKSVSISVSLVFLIGILGCIEVEAQPGGDRIRCGRVTSSSGTPVANARLILKNITTSSVRSITVNSDGSYLVANLVPGIYEITASAQGFAEAHTTVEISADGKPVVNFVMQAGTAVEAGKTSSTAKGAVTTSVSELPLNGRSASDVAALEPGVATARTQSTGQAQRGFGTQMTISGGRPRQNDAQLDGISVNDYSNGPPASALGVSLGSDAVEQFSVLTSNYPAQYGRSSGGIIGASTRSGTNSFHGSAFEYIRNSAFDARNFFDNVKPALHRNQFGASAGGPIWQEHTFVFGDYEGLRQSQGLTQVATVPSAAARAGNLSTGRVTPDATVQTFLNAFYPLPNGPLLGAGDTGVFTFAGQTVTPENYFTTKVDHKFSEQDALSGTYMFDKGNVRQPDELNDKRTGYDSQRQFAAVHETHTFSAQLRNSFRFGVNRVVAITGLNFPSGNSHVADPSFGAVPGTKAPAIIVPGLTFFSGGLGTPSNFSFHWTSIQAGDDIARTKGAHSVKFGANLERMRDNILAVSDPGGEFSFNF